MARTAKSKPANGARKRGRPRSAGSAKPAAEPELSRASNSSSRSSSSRSGSDSLHSGTGGAVVKEEAPLSPSFAVVPGLTVFAFHGPLLYQAKVRKIHRANAQLIETEGPPEQLDENPALDEAKYAVTTYLLHYNGWNSKWDEWVTCDRILEFNEVNKLRKQEMDNQTKRKRQSTSLPPAKAASEEPSRKKTAAKKSRSADTALPLNSKLSHGILLAVSSELKEMLVDDWENITLKKQLVQLPAKTTVSMILKGYRLHRHQVLVNEQQTRVLDEVVDGLAAYFDGLVGLMLLYRFENLQHLQFIKDQTILSTRTPQHVFGLEHFLRLLVSLPEFVGQTSMDPVSVAVLLNEVTVLLEYLHENRAVLAGSYINTSPQYGNLSQ